MSRFIDKLKKVGQITSQPMGFAQRASRGAKNANMLVVGLMTSPDPGLAETAAKSGVDAVALTLTGHVGKDVLTTLTNSLGDVPLGCNISTSGDIEEDSGDIDFGIISDIKIPASEIQDMDKGTILTIDTTWSDSFIRSVDLMPIDAFLIDLSDKDTLTLDLAINCQRVGLLSQKPIIAYVKPSLGAEALTVLRDVGIKALAVDVAESSKNGMLNQLCESAHSLEPRKRKPERRDALVPAMTRGVAPHDEEDDDDD